MKEVLILNLTRMGDLIQTTPVIQGIKECYPECRITLVVNGLFEKICSFIPYVDDVIVFDMKEFQTIACGGAGIVEQYRYAEDFIKNINSRRYDLAINFTHSRPSAVLLALSDADDRRGFMVDSEGNSIIRYPWMKYFFNVIPNRDFNSFHLSDIYVKSGGFIPVKKGLHLNVPQSAKDDIRNLLQSCQISDSDTLIAMQLGASAEDKRWTAASFAALADKLFEEKGMKIVLVGTGSEEGLGREFELSARSRSLNLIGKTDLSQLTALLHRCDMLVSNDTGPLHIATAVGTKVLDISVASVHFRETGPYGENFYVIQSELSCCPCSFYNTCKNPVCKDTVTPDNVYSLVCSILNNDKNLESIQESDLWKNVQVYRSYFEDDGLIEYRPLIKRPVSRHVLYSHIFRQTWLRILDVDRPSDPFGTIYEPSVIEAVSEAIFTRLVKLMEEWYNDEISGEFLVSIDEEISSLRRLKELAEEGFIRVSLIGTEARKLSPDVSRIKDLWSVVPDIDEEIDKIGNIFTSIHPLTVIFSYGRSGLEGSDLKILTAETARLYDELRVHVSMVLSVIDKILNRYSDKAVVK
ncbi:MAG: glycosyltransferase family 9 protein [Dissulfurispiraceae bacterium]|nr:glycosyltransferase family 9 protein [Dissulfurispiraceae bacterium]